ncbi:MAG: septum formation initiator family protein [Actinomycetota bacterium]|nr:septum formation initiator family protein [Actinomycetota bacterium]
MRGERRPGMWRQIAVLGAVLVAVALAIAVPLRSYLQQRDELTKALTQQQQLAQQVADLQQQKAALQDPNYVKAEARRRLQYVSPGETVYRVVAPKAAAPRANGSKKSAGSAKSAGSSTAAKPAGQPWYGQMWDTLTEDAGGK